MPITSTTTDGRKAVRYHSLISPLKALPCRYNSGSPLFFVNSQSFFMSAYRLQSACLIISSINAQVFASVYPSFKYVSHKQTNCASTGDQTLFRSFLLWYLIESSLLPFGLTRPRCFSFSSSYLSITFSKSTFL